MPRVRAIALAELAEGLGVVVHAEPATLARRGEIFAALHRGTDPALTRLRWRQPVGSVRSSTSSTVMAPSSRPASSRHAERQHVVAGQPLGDLALGEVGGDGRLLLDAPAELHARRLAQQPLEVDDAEVGARSAACTAAGRRTPGRRSTTSQSGSRISASASATVARRAEDDDVGRHQRAGGAFVVAQQPAHDVGVLGVHRVEDSGALLAGHLGQQVGEVVVLHLLEHVDEAVEVEALDDPQLLGLGQLLEQVGEALVVHRLGELLALGERHRPHDAGDVAGVHVAQAGRLGGHLGAGACGTARAPRTRRRGGSWAGGAARCAGPGGPWRAPTTSGGRR